MEIDTREVQIPTIDGGNGPGRPFYVAGHPGRVIAVADDSDAWAAASGVGPTPEAALAAARDVLSGRAEQRRQWAEEDRAAREEQAARARAAEEDLRIMRRRSPGVPADVLPFALRALGVGPREATDEQISEALRAGSSAWCQAERGR